MIVSLNFSISREKRLKQWFLMRSHRLIAVVTLLSFWCCTSWGVANSGQIKEGEREQKILRIQQLIQEQNLAEAQRELTKAAKQYPADEGFENLLGIVEAQQGHYAAAEKGFRRAIASGPKFTGAYLNLGRLYQEHVADDPATRPKALEVYRRVLEYDPANAEAHYQSAAIFLQQLEYQKSLDHVSHLAAENQNSAQTLSIRCADYAGLGNRQGADEAAAGLMAAPDFSISDAQQALLGLIPGKREDLIVSLLESLQSRQQLPAGLLRSLGLAYEQVNRLADARAALDKSFVEGNSSVGLLLELTRIAREQKDFQGALGYLGHARDLEPDNASLHYHFGVVCVDMNLIVEARDSFERAVKIEPENPDYNYALGAASTFRHDPADAVPYFEKYLKLRPQDPRGKLAMGAALFRAKDYDAAIPWLKQAAGNPGTAVKAHYYLGAIALEEGELDEAFINLQEALKGEPDYADALAALGHYYMMRTNYEQAEKQIQHALKTDPDHYAANFYLLTLYTRTKDSRQEVQARRFDELEKLLAEKRQEFLRIVEVRPLEIP